MDHWFLVIYIYFFLGLMLDASDDDSGDGEFSAESTETDEESGEDSSTESGDDSSTETGEDSSVGTSSAVDVVCCCFLLALLFSSLVSLECRM